MNLPELAARLPEGRYNAEAKAAVFACPLHDGAKAVKWAEKYRCTGKPQDCEWAQIEDWIKARESGEGGDALGTGQIQSEHASVNATPAVVTALAAAGARESDEPIENAPSKPAWEKAEEPEDLRFRQSTSPAGLDSSAGPARAAYLAPIDTTDEQKFDRLKRWQGLLGSAAASALKHGPDYQKPHLTAEMAFEPLIRDLAVVWDSRAAPEFLPPAWLSPVEAQEEVERAARIAAVAFYAGRNGNGKVEVDPILATIDQALVQVVSANALKLGMASDFLEAFRMEQGKSIVLCEALLRTRNVALLVGRAWAGKTTLATNLVRSLLLGDPFLGRPCRANTKIAYLALERNGSEVAEQFEKWGIADRIFFLDRVPIGEPREMARALAYEIHRQGIEVTIVDHLVGMIHIEDGNDYVGVSRALAPFNAIAKYTSSLVVLLHHQPKTAGAGSEINVMGSEAFRAATDALMEASKIGQSYFFRAQSRGVADIDRTRIFRKEDGLIEAEPGVDGLKSELLAALTFAEGPLTSKTVLEQAPELKQVPLKNVMMALKRLVDDGQIFREGKGRRGSPFYYSIKRDEATEGQALPPKDGNLFDK